MKRFSRTAGLPVVLAASVGFAAAAQAQVAVSRTPMAEQETVQVGSVTRYKVRGPVYMYSAVNGNTVVELGDDGVVVIDPQGGAAAVDILADIARLTAKPIRLVINTTAEMENLAGNRAVASAGVTLEGGNTRPVAAVGAIAGAPIWAHEGVLARLTAAGQGETNDWPSDTYFVERKDFALNGGTLALTHAPAAHAAGDSFVGIQRYDIIAAGDVYTPDRYPNIDVANGGSVNGLIAALNQLIRMAAPAFNQEGGTLIVPAHGRISDEADLAEYRDMITIIRDRVQDLIKRKMTLAQIQAARPSADYDARYGTPEGAHLVAQIHASLSQASRGSRP